MTVTVIPFPYNDQPMPDAQRQRIGPASLLMEAQAIHDAATLYRDARGAHDRIAAIGRMGRLLTHGSPAAQEAARIWRDLVLGTPDPTPAPVLVDYDPFEGVPGGADAKICSSDYAD